MVEGEAETDTDNAGLTVTVTVIVAVPPNESVTWTQYVAVRVRDPVLYVVPEPDCRGVPVQPAV
jgi:hypothetical protein